MIGYTTLGSNDIQRAGAFYDTLFAEIGVKRLMDFERGPIWGFDWHQPTFSIMKPFDGQPASVGNGTMVAIACKSPEQVDALHKKAMELGSKDEGAPGPRGGGFYCGYFRDLDGNKLNAFCVTKA